MDGWLWALAGIMAVIIAALLVKIYILRKAADEMANAFACCLKELRKFKGYTLKQVADGTEIPFQTIARYESGENTPSIIQAFKLAYFYNIELTDMFLAGYIDEDNREKFFEEQFGQQ